MDWIVWLLAAPFLVALIALTALTVGVFVLSVFGMVVDVALKAIHAVDSDYESGLTRASRYFG